MRRIHETFTAGPQAARFTALSAWEARRKTLIETLQSKVFAAVPRKPRNVRVEGAGTELRLTSTTLCLSARHGGSRPRRARPLPALLYIASDGDDPATIASGPTVADVSTFQAALGVLQQFGGMPSFPASVVDRLRSGARGAFFPVSSCDMYGSVTWAAAARSLCLVPSSLRRCRTRNGKSSDPSD